MKAINYAWYKLEEKIPRSVKKSKSVNRLVPWNGLKIFFTNMLPECWYSCLNREMLSSGQSALVLSMDSRGT